MAAVLGWVWVVSTESVMSTTVEKRLDELEKKVEDLTRLIAPSAKRDKDWRRTFGMSANDPGFDEMVKLGQEYRKSHRVEDEPDADPGY